MKESWEGIWEGLEKEKRRKKLCNYTITSKIKEIKTNKVRNKLRIFLCVDVTVIFRPSKP